MDTPYCIIEDPVNSKQILALVLTIEYCNPGHRCIITCCNKTKETIENFPKKINLKIDFLEFKSLHNVFDIISSIQNTIKTLEYCIEKYNSVLVLNQNNLMVNTFQISEDIKKQGYSFIKKKQHDNVHRDLDYSLDIYYLNDIKYLHYVIDIFNDNDFLDDKIENLIDYEYNLQHQQKIIAGYRKLASKFSKDTEIYLNEETMLATEDFFRYENSIKSDDIKANFTLNEKQISFVMFRFKNQSPIKEIENLLLNRICRYKPDYVQIFSLLSNGGKFTVLAPKLDGIGIWNRNKSNNILKELLDLTEEKYDNYYNIIKDFNDYYYTCGTCVIYDKPNINWITNSIKKYSWIKLIDYDENVIKLCKEEKLNVCMLGYIGLYPKILFDFIQSENYINTDKNNLIFKHYSTPENEEDFKQFLKDVSSFKYCLFKKNNIPLISTVLALNIIPIIPKDSKLLNLKQNKHYIYEEDLDNIEYNKLYENIKESKVIIRTLKDFLNNLC